MSTHWRAVKLCSGQDVGAGAAFGMVQRTNAFHDAVPAFAILASQTYASPDRRSICSTGGAGRQLRPVSAALVYNWQPPYKLQLQLTARMLWFGTPMSGALATKASVALWMSGHP